MTRTDTLNLEIPAQTAARHVATASSGVASYTQQLATVGVLVLFREISWRLSKFVLLCRESTRFTTLFLWKPMPH
eukprot:COSAG01_NODE_61519_length_289_cov_0.800000_1_plen_74_part_10